MVLQTCELQSNLLKGIYIGGYIWEYYTALKGDTRSLDNSSCTYAHGAFSTGEPVAT